MTDPVLDAVRAIIDAGAGEPLIAPDVINQPMIRHWCSALGDTNPVYLDPTIAAATAHGEIIAPPAMLGVWTMETPRSDGGPRDRALRALDAAGFPAVVATDYEQEYLTPLTLGMRLTELRSVEWIDGPKQTALGEGYFIGTRYDYRDQDGDLVGVARMKLLRFRPSDAVPATAEPFVFDPATMRPRPVINPDNAFFWEGVDRGELLIQRCTNCGVLRHPPRPMCGSCTSTEWDTVRSSGAGTVYSFVVHHYPPLPGVEPPFVVALVELAEGIRFVSNLVDIDPSRVEIGMPVELTFRAPDSDLTLPLFRPAGAAT